MLGTMQPEVVAKNPVSVIGKREDHPNGWSSLLLCCAALIDANLKKSIKSRGFQLLKRFHVHPK
jgi:hypothetical protein